MVHSASEQYHGSHLNGVTIPRAAAYNALGVSVSSISLFELTAALLFVERDTQISLVLLS
jgi:hypothetical protein